MLRGISLGLLLLVLTFNSYAKTIDIQCRYNLFGPRFAKNEHSSNIKKIIYFSINPKNNEVAGGIFEDKEGLTFPATANIYPDRLIINERFLTDEGHKHLISNFIIDRVNGDFSGAHYEVDSKTNKDVEEYSILGKCYPIKRLF